MTRGFSNNPYTKATLVLLGGLGLLLVGCRRDGASGEGAADGSKPLARVAGLPITEKQFRHQWRQRPGSDTAQAREEVLEGLITRSALASAARREGLDQNPEIAGEIDRLLIAGLREKLLRPRLESARVSEEALRAHYEQHRQTQFLEPERVRVAVLWFDTQGQAPLVERFRARLDTVRAQVLAEATAFPVVKGFGSLSVANSEHRVSRYQGGDVGWLSVSSKGDTAGGWEGVVRRIADGLASPGDLSGVVDTPEGVFLVRLIERRPATTLDFASVRDRIEKTLLTERRRQIEADFQREMVLRSPVERYPTALTALEGLEATNSLARGRPARPIGPPTLP